MHPTHTTLLLITLLFLTPFCAASAPRSPGAVVSNVERVGTHNSPPSSYDSDVNITWRLSADDPDQINGTYNYTLWFNSTANAQNGGCTATSWASGFCSGWIPQNITKGSSLGACQQYAPIPNAPGWVGTVFCGFSGPMQPGDFDKLLINITAWDGPTSSAASSQPSCLTNVSLRVLATDTAFSPGHDQCGYPQVRAPSGASALVTLVGNASVASQIDVRANLSADDFNTTQGNLSYRLFLYTQDYDVNSSGANLGLDPRTAADTGGIRLNTVTIGGTPPGIVFIQWRAEEPNTHQWSNLSCSVSVNTASPGASDACGVLGDSTNTTQGAPTFPMFDVTTFANNSGISLTLASWLLIGVLAAFFIFIAFALAGAEGAVAVGATVIPFAYVLNLLPLWALILLFALAAIAAVTTWGRRA